MGRRIRGQIRRRERVGLRRLRAPAKRYRWALRQLFGLCTIDRMLGQSPFMALLGAAGVTRFEAGEPIPLDWPGKTDVPQGPVGTVTITAVDRETGTITVKPKGDK